MKSLGQIGYEAYGEHAYWKNFQGDRMPNWEDLPDAIKLHWETAASAIVRSANG
jgi:hypothetical protein